jgi:GNAT superfamily N-acetyltransferase
MTHFRFRRVTPADRDALVAFNADVLRYQDAPGPDEGVGAWTADLLDGRHPQVRPEDFSVVEDLRSQRIASSLCVISQTWSYGGVALSVGQPELVGTHPDYRGQGLVRRQLESLHQWSAARGQHVLAIDGIPGFYRQFGYEMALALHGELSVETAVLPRGVNADVPPPRVRAARDSDIAFLMSTDNAAHGRYLLAACRDLATWRYELQGRSAQSQSCVAVAIIERHAGAPLGFVVYKPRLSGTTLTLIVYELIPSASWEAVTPSVLQYLRSMGEAGAAPAGRCDRIGLCLGSAHPAYAAIQHLKPRDDGAYAWQLRVADVPAFLRHVAPVLERRLAQSDLAEYTGHLRVSFYRDGVRLRFEHGRLVEAVAWQPSLDLRGIEKGVPSTAERADASFPGRTFSQLLFGLRSLDELQYAFPDCLVRTDAARPLLTTLFPTERSNIWPVL